MKLKLDRATQGFEVMAAIDDALAPFEPGFDQGAKVAAICDAMERSASDGRWVDVSEIETPA